MFYGGFWRKRKLQIKLNYYSGGCMKRQRKESNSVWKNFIYSLKTIFSIDKTTPIMQLLLLFISLASSVYITYENKLFLDALESNNNIEVIILIILGIIGLNLLINSINVIVGRIYRYLLNSKLYYKLYLRSHIPLFNADYDNIESPEYKNVYLQYKQYASGAVIGEFSTVSRMIGSFISLVVFGTMVSTLQPLIILGLIVMSILHFLAKKPLVKLQHSMNILLVKNNRKFDYSTSVSTDFSNAKEVRLYNMSPWLKSITDECMMKHKKLHAKLQWAAFGVGVCHQLLRLLRDGFAYIYLILLFADGDLTSGNFVLYFTAISSFSDTLNIFSEYFNEIHKYDLQINEVRKIEEIKSSRNRGVGLPLPRDDIEIEFRNVSFRYPSAEKYTIRNLNLTIKGKEKIALVGINGAGKTTFVKLLCGLYIPTEGTIYLNGYPVNEYNINEYYSIFGAVFQDVNIMPLTIAQNIACTMDNEKIDRDRVLLAIRKVGLYEKVRSLKYGIDTFFDKEVNKEAVDFSGGEKQKLALARALYANRPFFILDEPTSALDPIAEHEMYVRFNEITQNESVLFISHRLASTRFCDRIVHLENGVIIEMGTHDELMRNNGKYAEMFNVQSQYYCEKAEEKNA